MYAETVYNEDTKKEEKELYFEDGLNGTIYKFALPELMSKWQKDEKCKLDE